VGYPRKGRRLAPKKSKKQDLLDVLLEAAKRHGKESEPDMEVGDLQGLVMLCWPCLTKKQQQSIGVMALTELGLAEWMKPVSVKVGGVEIKRF
jgi:hypothetical protein